MTLFVKIIKNVLGFVFFIYLKILKINVVFLFHDVTNHPSVYCKENRIYIKTKNFKKIINHINKHFSIINPKLLQSDIKIKNKNYALITFDDGYKSYLKNVVPFFEKKNIPSLIFLNCQVSIYKKENINAVIDYFSRDKMFQQYMKQNKISKPYYLNCNLNRMESFLKEFNSKYKKEKNKIIKFQGEYLNSIDLKKLDQHNLVNFGNHLFNHWNIIKLQSKQIKKQFNMNKYELSKYKSHLNFFAIPNGKFNLNYNQKNLKIIKKNKAKKIFSSNNHILNNFNNYLIDRVSLENEDTEINFIYFKILKHRLKNLFLI